MLQYLVHQLANTQIVHNAKTSFSALTYHNITALPISAAKMLTCRPLLIITSFWCAVYHSVIMRQSLIELCMCTLVGLWGFLSYTSNQHMCDYVATKIGSGCW